jgi:hypothetical protein
MLQLIREKKIISHGLMFDNVSIKVVMGPT